MRATRWRILDGSLNGAQRAIDEMFIMQHTLRFLQRREHQHAADFRDNGAFYFYLLNMLTESGNLRRFIRAPLIRCEALQSLGGLFFSLAAGCSLRGQQSYLTFLKFLRLQLASQRNRKRQQAVQ